MGALILMSALLLGCAPPLPGTGLPAVSFLFPESRDDIVHCPDMVIVVGISDYEIGAPDDEGSPGHWHLKDSSGKFLLAAMGSWVSFTFGPDDDFSVPQLTSISGVLAGQSHVPIMLCSSISRRIICLKKSSPITVEPGIPLPSSAPVRG
ncbi:MAG: hypothetical protein ACI8S6_005407 [Myxococcota bacterium]|jgi:hypothetical protein